MTEKPTTVTSTSITPGMKVQGINWVKDDTDYFTVVHVHKGEAWVEGEGWKSHLRPVTSLRPLPPKWEKGKRYRLPSNEILKVLFVDDEGNAYGKWEHNGLCTAREAGYRRHFTEVTGDV